MLQAQDFGARGDGKTDDGPAVQKMLDAAAKAQTPVELRFAPNKKYFLKTGRNRYAFFLDGAKNWTLNGGGSLFLVDSEQRFLKIVNSQHIAVRNFNIDYVPLPFADGTIVAKDKAAGTIDVQIDADQAMPPAGGATHQDGEQAYFGALWNRGVYSDEGRGGTYQVRGNFDVKDVSAPLPDRIVRVQSNPKDGIFDGITPGQSRFSIPVRGIAHRYGPGDSVWLDDNTNLTLENIELWSAPWFAFGVNGNRGKVTFRHVNVRPKPGTTRNASAWRDGFHVKNNRASLLWEDCIVQGNSDDAFNISSHTSTVREVVSPTQIKISQNYPLGVAAMEKGDTLVFYSPTSGKIVGRALIAAVNPAAFQGERAPLFTLDLDAPIAGIKAGSTLVWNEQSGNPDTVLRRCRMDTSCRFRSPVMLDGCQVNALAWFTGDEIESPLPSHVKVINSQFRLGQGNPNIVILMGGMFLEGHGPSEPVISDVVFDRNRIWGDFVVGDVKNLVLTDNDFAVANRPLIFNNVAAVSLRGNRHAGKLVSGVADLDGDASKNPAQFTFSAERAGIRPNALFSDHAVLQRNAPGRSNSKNSKVGSMLKVSQNGRYLVRSDGKPFFWLGDTAWLLFQMTTREDAELYLSTRARQDFTVIQAAIVMGEERVGGTLRPNVYGDLAFVDGDPARPKLTQGNSTNDAAQYDYWDHVDHIVNRAAAHGLTLGLLPLFVGVGSEGYKYLTPANAYTYGLFLGQRYGKQPHVFWILGGDNSPNSEVKRQVWNELARGITVGVAGAEDYSRTLMTYHINGGASSSQWFHTAPWLDFNMLQEWGNEKGIYAAVSRDYNLKPVKPAGLGEGSYEDGTPYPTRPIDALKIRNQAYWSYMAGGYHTYGNTNTWNFGSYKPEATQDWKAALSSPGVENLSTLVQFFTGREWWKLVPDLAVFAANTSKREIQNAAMSSTDGDSLVVYLPSPTTVSLHMEKIATAKSARATWIDPKTGARTTIGVFPTTGTRAFSSPQGWPDALLLIEAE